MLLYKLLFCLKEFCEIQIFELSKFVSREKTNLSFGLPLKIKLCG